jgi:hypothetical protein
LAQPAQRHAIDVGRRRQARNAIAHASTAGFLRLASEVVKLDLATFKQWRSAADQIATGMDIVVAEHLATTDKLNALVVADAAVDIADTDGLSAVSMQRVAAQFAVTKMALYRYVASKAELLAVLIEAAVGDTQPWTTERHWNCCASTEISPALTAAVDASPRTKDHAREFGLKRILDGLALRIGRRPGPPV